MIIENINFDIFYKILENLDPYSIRNILLSSKNLYIYNNQIRVLLLKKIINRFSILKDIQFKFGNNEHDVILSKFLNNIDHFYKNQDIRSINILIHYIHFKVYSNEDKTNLDVTLRENLLYIFEFLISKYHSNINGDESYYLSKYMITHIIDYCSINELDIMFKNINISYQSIALYFDYLNHHASLNLLKINKLFDYLCWKHFFGNRNSSYQGIDAHNILLCKLIKIYEYRVFYNDNISDVIIITNNMFEKQKKYRFVFDYQRLFNACVSNNSEYYLNLIFKNLRNTNIERVDRNLDKLYIIITAKDIEYIVKNKFFGLLKKIIDIHLGTLINLQTYIDGISKSIIDFSEMDMFRLKLSLKPYLTIYNNNLLFSKK